MICEGWTLILGLLVFGASQHIPTVMGRAELGEEIKRIAETAMRGQDPEFLRLYQLSQSEANQRRIYRIKNNPSLSPGELSYLQTQITSVSGAIPFSLSPMFS